MIPTRFRIDPLNPGHYYACCGLLELISREHPDAESMFDLSSGAIRRAEFIVRTGREPDWKRLFSELRSVEADRDGDYEKGIRPVTLKLGTGDLTLDWWLDWFREDSARLKCWAGQVTTGNLMDEIQRMLPTDAEPCNLFYAGRMMTAKFGIDPRSAWTALDVGYSPNEHNQEAATFPAVELLGAIGLQGFRPSTRSRDEVTYYLWEEWLGRLPARRAAVEPWDGLKRTPMMFQIAKRGQSSKYFTFGKPKRNETK